MIFFKILDRPSKKVVFDAAKGLGGLLTALKAGQSGDSFRELFATAGTL